MATEAADDIEIPVWIGNQQKWITGLNRKTTCHDVIYILLGYMNAEVEDIAKYAIYESWRGVERPLAGRTKLGKVWQAYGPDCENVVLTVRPFDLDTSCEVSHCKPRVHHRSSKYRTSRTDLSEQYGSKYCLLPTQSSKCSLPHKQSSYTGLRERHANKDTYPERYSSRTHLMDQRLASGSRDTFASISSRKVTDKPPKPYKVTLPPKHKRSRTTEGARESKQNIMTSCHSGAAKTMQCLRHPHGEISSTYEDIYSRRSRTKKESRHERTSKSLPRDSRHRRAKQEKKHKDKKIQKIFQLIVSQERRIREQLDKLRSVDDQLAMQEAKRHEDMEQTLPELEDKDPNPELYPLIKSTDLEAYSHMCDNILEVQKKLTQEQSKIEEISITIREETIIEQLQVETLTESQIIGPKAGDFVQNDVKIQEELVALRKELDRASDIGKTQQSEIASITKSIEECDRQLAEKSKIVSKLLGELKEMGDDGGISQRDNSADHDQANDQVKMQQLSCMQQKLTTMDSLGSSHSTVQSSIQTSKPHQMTSPQENAERDAICEENAKGVGQSATTDDMYTLTIVSDFNSTWDEDTFLVTNEDVTKAIREGRKFLPGKDDDPKKSPTGESSASSGFSELSPTEDDNKTRKRVANWCKKTFPFPSYDTMKNLRFDGSRKPSEESESGNSSLEDQVTQETLV